MSYYELNIRNDLNRLMSFRAESKSEALALKREMSEYGFDVEMLELSDGPLFDTIAEVSEDEDIARTY